MVRGRIFDHERQMAELGQLRAECSEGWLGVFTPYDADRRNYTDPKRQSGSEHRCSNGYAWAHVRLKVQLYTWDGE